MKYFLSHRLKTLGVCWGVAWWLSCWACLAGAAPPLAGQDWLVIKYEPADPLNAPLWSGQPQKLLSALPRSVGVLVFAPQGSTTAQPIAGPWTEIQRVPDWRALPDSVRDGLSRFGHDLREVSVEPAVLPPFRAVGDSGIGQPLPEGSRISLPVVSWGNDACGTQPPPRAAAGAAVLIRRGGCPFVDKLQAAKRAGARAVLIVNNAQAINRVAGPCTDCQSLVLAALPRAEGEALIAAAEAAAAAGHTLQVNLQGQRALASAIRVGRDGRVQEVGYIPYPFNHLLDQPLDPFFQLALEARHLEFESQQLDQMKAQEASAQVQVIEVFNNVLARDPTWSGQRVSARVALPQALLRSERLWWDLALSCEGVLKSQCPPWDYIAQMFLCQDPMAERCEDEVGRWITPYWSGGRWVHDTTALLARLRLAAERAPQDSQGRPLVRFEFHSIQPYRVSARLRFAPVSNPHRVDRRLQIPIEAQRLPFPGGLMTDGGYGQRQGVSSIRVPAGVVRVELAALLSGHGFADDDKCAEFCNTVHHFEVHGNAPRTVSQPAAGTEMGCLEQVAHGVVPNQGGTWVYGRNGWCPGAAVPLTMIDISDEVAHARRVARVGPDAEVTLSLRYWATVNGKDHAPKRSREGRESDARLDVTSYVVFYGSP